ncbi:hypothetical protein ACHAXT_002487 [Thalassiosira profunda]
MYSPATPLLHRLPPSCTAPDAWLALLLLGFLQYKQYARRKDGKGKIHAGAKAKPQRAAAWSLVHEWLFARLHMLVSPFANQASELHADVVDLQSEDAMGAYADKVASGKAKKKKQQRKQGEGGDGEMMEVRGRRIVTGELVYNGYFPLLETVINLALAIVVGLSSRWVLGLVRALRLSRAPGGPCCSPYRGGDDAGTRLPGSFERLLACVLVKQEGDAAGTLVFSVLLLLLLGGVVRLAWSVSSPSAAKNEDAESDADAGETKKSDSDEHKYRRIHPRKVKRFFVGLGATLSSLMLFHTPALLRMLGLDGLPEAIEELGARLLLFGNLLGVVTLPESLEGPSESFLNGLLALLAIAWGLIAAGMMTPIDETARNAAHVLSPSPSKKGKKNPQEMMDLINVRMMLLIQALAPFIIMCTYLANARFAETTKASSGGGDVNLSFRRQYLSNSGLFVRVAVSWCFLGASLYTCRALLQSFLDQAATVASAMATLGEGSDASAAQGARGKRTAASKRPTDPPKRDPFDERYRTLVLTAGRIAAFPAFVLAMLAVAHLRGGDGGIHPGVGHESLPKGAPRSMLLPVRGLLPPYSDQYMSWMANLDKADEQSGAGDALLHAAALSQASWETAPGKDSAQMKIVSVLGRNKFCYPPEVRSVRAMGRHVNFLLDSDEGDNADESMLTANPFTGRELMDMAPELPATLAGVMMGGKSSEPPEETTCNAEEAECTAEPAPTSGPSFAEMLSFIASHRLLTPTVVFPIVDAIAFLSSVWCTYWCSIKMTAYWLNLRGAASLRITT